MSVFKITTRIGYRSLAKARNNLQRPDYRHTLEITSMRKLKIIPDHAGTKCDNDAFTIGGLHSWNISTGVTLIGRIYVSCMYI